MIPTRWRVETLTEGRIFLLNSTKRNRINFDCTEAIIYPWTGGYGPAAQKIFSLYATEIKTKELKIHARGLLAKEVYTLN